MNNFEQTTNLWNEITKTLTKLSYISAGTISLSISFLGYILSIGSSARFILSLPFIFNIPTIYLLFLSWVFLFISLFFGIIIRIPNAWYLFNSHIQLWFTDLAEKTTKNDKKNYEFVANSGKNSKEKYWKASLCIRYITILFFALGIMTLLIFSIITANRLINI